MKVFYEIPGEVSYQGPVEVDCRTDDLVAMVLTCAAHYDNLAGGWELREIKEFTLYDGKQKLAEGIEAWISCEPVYETNIH